MPNGSLADQFEKHYNEEWILKIAHQVATAISYLHACNPKIIYGDIKAQNILIDKYYDAKLADVGISRALPSSTKTNIRAGSHGFLPPETFLSTKLDMYSFGMLLLQMIAKNKDVYQAKRDCQKNAETMSENIHYLYMVALECIQNDPEDRPSMDNILKCLAEEFSHIIHQSYFAAVSEHPAES
jgi:serine/threonine protein kinase